MNRTIDQILTKSPSHPNVMNETKIEDDDNNPISVGILPKIKL